MTDLTYWHLVMVPFKFTNRPDDVMAIKIKLSFPFNMQWVHVLCHKGKHGIKIWLAYSLGVQGSKKSSLCDIHNFSYFIFVQGAATFPKRALSYINSKKSKKCSGRKDMYLIYI